MAGGGDDVVAIVDALFDDVRQSATPVTHFANPRTPRRPHPVAVRDLGGRTPAQLGRIGAVKSRLLALAEELGNFVDYVGGTAYATSLLAPLETLATVEETVVREKAVESLNKVCSQLSPEHLLDNFIPLVRRLAGGDWFTSRISACGLFALSFKAVADDASAAALRGELRETFKALGIDDAPMVRRSTAGRLAEFAEVLSESMVIEDLLPLYFTLCTDEQDSVRARSIRPR